jgi:L-alanine-DL-glutamate epimerase-like enolase superfamily enzyme
MRITEVRTVQLTRRLERPQRNAREARGERTFTCVLVETDAGLTGLGDAFGDQALMPTILERRLRPMALGLDPCDQGAVWRRLFASGASLPSCNGRAARSPRAAGPRRLRFGAGATAPHGCLRAAHPPQAEGRGGQRHRAEPRPRGA